MLQQPRVFPQASCNQRLEKSAFIMVVLTGHFLLQPRSPESTVWVRDELAVFLELQANSMKATAWLGRTGFLLSIWSHMSTQYFEEHMYPHLSSPEPNTTNHQVSSHQNCQEKVRFPAVIVILSLFSQWQRWLTRLRGCLNSAGDIGIDACGPGATPYWGGVKGRGMLWPKAASLTCPERAHLRVKVNNSWLSS